MKLNIIKTSVISLMFIVVSPIYADTEGKIIVGKDVEMNNISKKEIENIFLGRQTMWDNGKRIKIAISANKSDKMDAFYSEYIGKTSSRFKKYWLKKVFAGYGVAPKLFKDSDRIMSFVKKEGSSIALVMSDEIKDANGIKVIDIE